MKTKKHQRQIVPKGHPSLTNYNVLMWAKHEIAHTKDKMVQPYEWMPEEAAEAKTPLAYAKKVWKQFEARRKIKNNLKA